MARGLIGPVVFSEAERWLDSHSVNVYFSLGEGYAPVGNADRMLPLLFHHLLRILKGKFHVQHATVR